jgi:hypothetical protein
MVSLLPYIIIPKICFTGIGLQYTDCLLTCLPGIASSSVAVHSDTSKLHGQGLTAKPFLAFGEGDTIALFVNRVKDTIEFGKNGMLVGTAVHGLPSQPMYPCIGFDSFDATLEVNFGSRPFKCAAAHSYLHHTAIVWFLSNNATPILVLCCQVQTGHLSRAGRIYGSGPPIYSNYHILLLLLLLLLFRSIIIIAYRVYCFGGHRVYLSTRSPEKDKQGVYGQL